uniref:Uncharacterized protein n=1 Tax=Oryza punctata TaxID=4537 RepID=A0A0E0LNG3_ORYPU
MRGIIPVQAKNLHSAEIELIAIAMAGNEADEHTSATASVLRDLSGTREEVARAREAAVKAWLSSMPLGEELERLRAELAAAKNRLAATAAEIGTLKSAVESTNDAIVARKEEAGEKRAAAEELRRRVDRGRDELRRLRSEVAAAREEKKQHAVEWRVLVRRQERRRDTENEHDDNTARRSRSGGSRLAVRKLPSWLCAIGRSGGLSRATAMAAPPRMAQTDER